MNATPNMQAQEDIQYMASHTTLVTADAQELALDKPEQIHRKERTLRMWRNQCASRYFQHKAAQSWFARIDTVLTTVHTIIPAVIAIALLAGDETQLQRSVAATLGAVTAVIAPLRKMFDPSEAAKAHMLASIAFHGLFTRLQLNMLRVDQLTMGEVAELGQDLQRHVSTALTVPEFIASRYENVEEMTSMSNELARRMDYDNEDTDANDKA